jgi:hypothetical protein
MPHIRLKSITCHQPDEKDDDEIFIKFQGNQVWPKNVKFQSIDAGVTLKIDLELTFVSGWADIELWEYDFWSKNDYLGNFYLKGDNYVGEYTCELERNKDVTDRAKYSLHWEIISR